MALVEPVGPSAQKLGNSTSPQSSPVVDPAKEPKRSFLTWAMYSIVSFAAYWFGAAQFDYDGDGDFDIDDVEVMFGVRDKPRRRGGSTGGGLNSPKSQGSSPKARPVGGCGAVGGGIGGLKGVLDANGDGEVDLLDLVEDAVDAEDADGDGHLDTAESKMMKHWPIFVVIQCVVTSGIWLFFSFIECETNKNGFCYNGWFMAKAGLDSLFPRQTDLRITNTYTCADHRFQVWRWLTYQFTHVGLGHICMNMFLTIVVGAPLNGFHGNWRMPIMFNVAVIGGAFGWAVADIHSPTVGMSGGCYGLIGMSLADLLMNWGQKRFRKPHLLMLIFLGAAETANYYLGHGNSGPRPSNAAHVGGFAAGLVIGCVIGKNLKKHLCELVFIGFMVFNGIVAAAFCVTWQFAVWPPRSIWESSGFCWLRQISNQTNFGTTDYQCVICGTDECINAWDAMPYQAAVSKHLCNSVMGGFQKALDVLPS